MIASRLVLSTGRVRAAVLAVTVLLVTATVVSGERAGAADSVADARSAASDADARLASAQANLAVAEQTAAEAQQRSNDAAQRLADAQARHAQLSDEIVVLESEIDDNSAAIAELREIVQTRAVAAYMGGEASPLSLFDSDGVVDAARRVALLSSAKRHEDEVLVQLRLLEEDLARKQTRVESDRAQVTTLIDELDAQSALINSELTGAQAGLTAAQDLLDTRSAEAATADAALAEAEAQAALAAEEARRAAEEEARRTAADEVSPGSTTTAPDPASNTEGEDPEAGDEEPSGDDQQSAAGTSILCPIDGPVSFVDSWGAPRPEGRTHEGVDIFSSKGAPNVAVVSGYVTRGIGERQGNGVFLSGDDGNSYWYFHLASYAGKTGHVEQGDVIGYTGDTGNAAPGAYHTHFEYHPDHGGPVNPYPIAAKACF